MPAKKRHTIAEDEDNPEWTDADFARARPFKEGFPELYASWAKQRGRPKVARPKVHIGLRLAADVVEAIRATGPGYNARVEKALRGAIHNRDIWDFDIKLDRYEVEEHAASDGPIKVMAPKQEQRAMRKILDAATVALLIASNIKRREDETGKEVQRVRMSEASFRKISDRRRIDDRFLDELNEVLTDHNLTLIRTSAAIGILRASAVLGWPRLNAARVAEELRDARAGTLNVAKLEGELGSDGAAIEDEDEEA
jgi:uncharacterized protein (DUF4415 family)